MANLKPMPERASSVEDSVIQRLVAGRMYQMKRLLRQNSFDNLALPAVKKIFFTKARA